MLVDDSRTRESLRQLVNGFTTDRHLQEDLMQECLVCLWRAECEKPGQTQSWYLQNCRFRALHWLALGRSVDSPKRSNAANRVPIDGLDDENGPDQLRNDIEPVDAVSLRDLISVLSRRLTQRERLVLEGLASGLRLKEVASEFRFSYPTALKCRRRIAAVLSKLGIPEPLSQRQARAGLTPDLSQSPPQEVPIRKKQRGPANELTGGVSFSSSGRKGGGEKVDFGFSRAARWRGSRKNRGGLIIRSLCEESLLQGCGDCAVRCAPCAPLGVGKLSAGTVTPALEPGLPAPL